MKRAVTRSVLFVCNGNVFRSPTAEYCLKQYLAKQGIRNWRVASAGVIATPEPIHPALIAVLKKRGIDVSKHRQKKLTRELVDRYDVIVAMAEDHLAYLKEKMGRKNAILFNELATGAHTSIWDLQDDVSNYLHNPEGTVRKFERTVEHIFRLIPQILENALDRVYLFERMVRGEVRHHNGYPFIPLYETPLAIAFVSASIPSREDGHILVIPKKRYEDLADIPPRVLRDVMATIQKVGNALEKLHGGYNVLLNNGRDAGQWVFHSHFHVIPRNAGDGIIIELWKNRNVNEKAFVELNRRIKKEITAQQ